MRIIVDTNVLASGLFFSGIPLQILRGVKRKKYTPVISSDIANEYKRTVQKLSVHFPKIDADEQLQLFITASEICEPKPLPRPVCKDLDDDKFIACAISSNTKIIVSGDKHLLDVSGYRGIEVLKPKQFADKYLK
jgi:putative PIN family toxin of toxin-antitoxin system